MMNTMYLWFKICKFFDPKKAESLSSKAFQELVPQSFDITTIL